MKYYFVIEENVSSNPDLRGTKFICKKGVRIDYGLFEEKNGFTAEHKADLELAAAERFYKTSRFKTTSDVWVHYIEIHEL